MTMTPDDIDDFERMERAAEHAAIKRQVALLRRLNRKELFTLAKHYAGLGYSELRYCEAYTDGWAAGGKEELCFEIAAVMVGETR
jgi:hypothetical protein